MLPIMCRGFGFCTLDALLPSFRLSEKTFGATLSLLCHYGQKTLVVFFMAYAVLNFVLSFVLSEGGANPDIWDGKYVLQSHGKLVRELSEPEYHLQLAYLLRGFSGHWMLFLFFARDLFLVPKRLIATGAGITNRWTGAAVACFVT